jgi:hypothetical protein
MTYAAEGYAVLHTDGHVTYGRIEDGEIAYEAIRCEIPHLGSQGMGRLRAWFTDDFTGQRGNPLADAVLSAVGYHHPTGWAGPVAVSMEEGDDGVVAPLLPEVRAMIDELARQHAPRS